MKLKNLYLNTEIFDQRFTTKTIIINIPNYFGYVHPIL